MSSDTPENDTTADAAVNFEKEDADTVETPEEAPATGVAAKAKAKEKAREESEAADRQFTVSARTLKRIAAGVVGVAVIAALAFGGWSLYDTKRELAAFDDSKTAASDFVTKYFSVVLGQEQSASTIKDAVLPLTTGAMHDRVEKDSQGAVDFAKETKIANFTSKITSSSVSSFDRDHAVVVVAAEFSGTSATAPTGGKNLMLLQLDMSKVDGDWLVSNLDVMPGVPTGSTPDQQPAAPSAPAPAPAPAG